MEDFMMISLSLSICNGLHPEIKDSTPEAYSKIMQACWNQDPLKRPDIFKLKAIFTKWRQNPPFNITQQFEHADDLDIMNNDICNTNLFNKFCNSSILIFPSSSRVAAVAGSSTAISDFLPLPVSSIKMPALSRM